MDSAHEFRQIPPPARRAPGADWFGEITDQCLGAVTEFLPESLGLVAAAILLIAGILWVFWFLLRRAILFSAGS